MDSYKLPDEVIAHIFSFLDKRSKVNASSVCKHWLKIFEDYSHLMQDVRISLKGQNDYFLEVFSKMTKRFCYFRFERVQINTNYLRFFKTFEKQFFRLTFDNCYLVVDTEQTDRKVQNCDNLLKLKVSHCSPKVVGMFSHLPALKSLHLCIGRRCLKTTMEHLQQVIPLSLTEFHMDYRGWNSICYPEVEDFIYKRRLNLKSLGFKLFQMANIDMDGLSKMEGLKLKRLKVCASLMSDGTIEAFCEHQRGIKVLHLIQILNEIPIKPTDQYVKDSTVLAICTFLPHLEKLTLKDCNGIKENVARIFQLRSLRKLSLYGCKSITQVSYRRAVRKLACFNLRTLNLCHTCIGASTLRRLVRLIPSLRKINYFRNDVLGSEWVESQARRLGCECGMTLVRRPK